MSEVRAVSSATGERHCVPASAATPVRIVPGPHRHSPPHEMTAPTRVELVCPAGTLPALKAAVDHGADCVYVGFRNETNARNFGGLNFDLTAVADGVRYAHTRGRKVLIAVNTYAQPGSFARWTNAIDLAADLGVDAVILADPGLMRYAAERHPDLRLHLSVQGSATTYEAINFYVRHFGIRRAVLPRVLSLAQVEHVVGHAQTEIEVFGFGSLCVMVEGRCALSSYATGKGPNTVGVCSPAEAVRWRDTADGLEVRLNGVLIDRYAKGEKAGYPTLCKGRYAVRRRHVLRHRGADFAQHTRTLARTHPGRRRRGQDRGPTTQPRLRRGGHARLARCD